MARNADYQMNGRTYKPHVPPGTVIAPAAFHAKKAAADGKPLNRKERRLAKRAHKTQTPTTPMPPTQEAAPMTTTEAAATDEAVTPEVDPATQPRQTAPEDQKPGVRYCDGWEVVMDEPTYTEAVGSDGHPVRVTQLRSLLLIDGREVYGCGICNRWSPSRQSIRAHLRAHAGGITGNADYLLNYLKANGFPGGNFTASNVRSDGVARNRFRLIRDLVEALDELVAAGHLVVHTDGDTPSMKRYAFAGETSNQVGEADAEAAGEHPGDTDQHPGDDQPAAPASPGVLVVNPATLEVIVSTPEPATPAINGHVNGNGKAPSPVDVARQPVDPMSLPLSALLARVADFESMRLRALRAEDRARDALEAQRKAESRATDAEGRLQDAEDRAAAAEESLDTVRRALGVMAPPLSA